MCDWEAEEYAEYLLWAEAAKARARAAPRAPTNEPSSKETEPVLLPPTLVEA